MESMEARALAARNAAEASLERRRSAAVARRGSGGMLLATGGQGYSSNVLSKQQQVQTAQEQYRHNIGWVHSIIKVIAQRISGQPLRVARLVKEEEIRRLNGMATKGNRFRRAMAKARLAQIRRRLALKARMPGFVKDFQEQVEILPGHPILELMRRPNPIMVRSVLLQVTIASLELTGRAFWWFVKPGDRGSITTAQDPNGGIELWPIPSSWVEPVHTEARLYDHWVITPPGGTEPIKVPGGQIGYMYYPDPSNPLGSLSPLQAQARAVVVDEAALEAQRRGMANGLYPGLALVVGRDPDLPGQPGSGGRPVLKREQRAQLIAAVKQAYRGPQNSEEPIILDGLITDVKPVTTSPREMAFMDTAKMSKERLTQGWNVNPISMGQVEGANRASSATADDHFVSNVINPRLEMISEVLTRWLPPLMPDDVDDASQLVYFEPAASYDPELARAELESMYDRGALTRNEYRAHFGYPPLADGDSCFVPGFGEVVLLQEDQAGEGDAFARGRGFLPGMEGMPRARFRLR